MKKILDFSLQDDIKIYTHHSIPLSVLSIDKNYIPWLNEHFVQLYSYIDREGVFRIDYTEYYRHYREVMDVIEISYEKAASIGTIIDFVFNAINRNLYVNLIVDEYYLKNKGAFKQFHYVRQLLINGYDKNGSIFYGMGYTKYVDTSLKGGSGYDKLAQEEISFSDLKIAYDEGRNYYKGPLPQYLLLLGRKSNAHDYLFNAGRFINRLDGYINSKGFHEYQLAIGQNVYADLAEHITGMIYNLDKVDSRAFFILHEHKKRLAKSIDFISEKYNLSMNTMGPLLAAYNSIIVKKAQMLFYQFLRYEYKAFKTRDYDDDGKLLPLDRESKEGKAKINDLNKIMESIKKYTSQEKSITLAIVNELKQHFKII
jgi:hypothetical protein